MFSAKVSSNGFFFRKPYFNLYFDLSTNDCIYYLTLLSYF